MDICAVVVWYNPRNLDNNQSAIENVKSYSLLCRMVYIVDNSNSDNSDLAMQIDNGVYLPNYENKGIAMALNIGCQRAYADGFEWVMTMDQDSYWDKNELGKYLSEAQKQIEDNQLVVSIAPDLIQPVVLSVAALLIKTNPW